MKIEAERLSFVATNLGLYVEEGERTGTDDETHNRVVL